MAEWFMQGCNVNECCVQLEAGVVSCHVLNMH